MNCRQLHSSFIIHRYFWLPRNICISTGTAGAAGHCKLPKATAAWSRTRSVLIAERLREVRHCILRLRPHVRQSSAGLQPHYWVGIRKHRRQRRHRRLANPPRRIGRRNLPAIPLGRWHRGIHRGRQLPRIHRRRPAAGMAETESVGAGGGGGGGGTSDGAGLAPFPLRPADFLNAGGIPSFPTVDGVTLDSV